MDRVGVASLRRGEFLLERFFSTTSASVLELEGSSLSLFQCFTCLATEQHECREDMEKEQSKERNQHEAQQHLAFVGVQHVPNPR